MTEHKDTQSEETRPDGAIPKSPEPISLSLHPASGDPSELTRPDAPPMAVVPVLAPASPPSLGTKAMASLADLGAMALFGYLTHIGSITGREAVIAALVVVAGKLKPANMGDASSGVATLVAPIAGLFSRAKG